MKGGRGEGHLYIGGVPTDLSTKSVKKSLKEKVIFQFDMVNKTN